MLFGKITKDKFAKQLIKAIQQTTGKTFEYHKDKFLLKLPGDGSNQINLTNIFKEHCNLEKKERSEHLVRIASIFATGSHDMPENFEDAKANLRPKIWNRSTFEFTELRCKVEGKDSLNLPLYPVGSHLYSSLVYDTEHSMRSISKDDLETWGVSYYEAMEHAVQNLDNATTAYSKIGDNFYSSISGDNYDSARLLTLDRIRSFEVPGQHIAVAPHRDALHVTGSDDPESLKIMFELTKIGAEEEVRPLCPLPLILEDGHWEDWIPPANHIVRDAYDQYEVLFLGQLYAEQKELLDALHQIQLIDVFVASFSTIQQPDEEKLQSFCVWPNGVDSLLPKTQLVMIMDDPDAPPNVVPWEEAMRVVGDLMEADDNYPTRYRVREYPTAEQITEMSKVDL